jgi:hypothetical protein
MYRKWLFAGDTDDDIWQKLQVTASLCNIATLRRCYCTPSKRKQLFRMQAKPGLFASVLQAASKHGSCGALTPPGSGSGFYVNPNTRV